MNIIVILFVRHIYNITFQTTNNGKTQLITLYLPVSIQRVGKATKMLTLNHTQLGTKKRCLSFVSAAQRAIPITIFHQQDRDPSDISGKLRNITPFPHPPRLG